MKYEITTIKNLLYLEGGKEIGPDSQSLDLYIPKGVDSFPVLVFLHGGGFIHYNWTKDTYESYCKSVAEAGIAVAAPNYRLLPEFPGLPKEINKNFCSNADEIFHGFMDDAAASMRWVKDHLKEYGPFNGDMFLGGHSAGAWQGMMLLFDEEYMNHFDMSPSELKGCIFASGQPTSHFAVLYARGQDPKLTLIDDAAPMYYFKPLEVPQLVTMAEIDMPSRAIQTQLYLTTLRAIGYKGAVEYIEYRDRTHDNCIVPDKDAPEEPCAVFYDTVKFINRYSSN